MSELSGRQRLDTPCTSRRRFSFNVDAEAVGQFSESIARYLGTGRYLAWQTILVIVWIALNLSAVKLRWDAYPFILLNLVFSTQAAYAAPLILLAQTRQADRDKVLAQADAKHREALAEASTERQEIATRQGEQLRALLESNTAVTEQNARLTEQLHELTREIHGSVCPAER